MTDRDPWYLEPWLPLLDRAVLAERMKREPAPLVGLEKMPSKLAFNKLNGAFEMAFHPCEQSLELGEIIVAAAIDHLLEKYADGEQAYLGKVNSKVTKEATEFICPIPVTGHAGAGKSSIIDAVGRAVLMPARVRVGGIEVQPDPMRIVPVGIAKSELALVRRVGGVGKGIEDCVPSAQRGLYRDGTAMLAFGEFQFATRSSTASTLVSGILLQGGYLGVPSVYDANFSLMWRLRKRPPEERDRLLFNPVVVHPDLPGSSDAQAITKSMLDVAPGVFQIDPATDGSILDVRTGGLRRLKRRLLSLAYQIKREGSRKSKVCVTIDDVLVAYNSNGYKDSRLMVEEMARRQDGVGDQKKDGLSCPFDEAESAAKVREKANRDFRDEQVAEQELHSAMTAGEKAALAARGKKTISRRSPPRQSAKNPSTTGRTSCTDRARNSAALAAEFS